MKTKLSRFHRTTKTGDRKIVSILGLRLSWIFYLGVEMELKFSLLKQQVQSSEARQ